MEEKGDFIIVPSYEKLEVFEPRASIFSRRIPLVCGDLVEIKQPFVHPIHESVRQFVLNEDTFRHL
jgi:hypothetical protein